MIKIIHGKHIIEKKISKTLNYDLYYRQNSELNLDSLTLENLIVLEYVKQPVTTLPVTTQPVTTQPIKQNIIGCWNSECNTIIYASHHKSFNQSIIKNIMENQVVKSDITLLLGDNNYERPKSIKLNSSIENNVDIIDNSIDIKSKIPINYKTIIKNGFDCFKSVVPVTHHFFLILGNHDDNETVMKYEIGLTYESATINMSGLNSYLNAPNMWFMPEEFYVLKIENYHYLMLNSNIMLKENSINESKYQEKLVNLYLNTYCNLADSTTDKKVVICCHEPFYAIGHKNKKPTINRLNISFYKIIEKYHTKIHSIFTADEHNTQELLHKTYNIKHIVASGAPYSGGDISFYPYTDIDSNFEIVRTYNSNVLMTNIQTNTGLTLDFTVQNDYPTQLIPQNITQEPSLSHSSFDLFLNDFKHQEYKADNLGNKKDKKKAKADKTDKADETDKVIDNVSDIDISILSTESSSMPKQQYIPIPVYPQHNDVNPETITEIVSNIDIKQDLINELNEKVKQFNEKYKKIIRYHNIGPKFQIDLTDVAFSQVKIDELGLIYDEIVKLTNNIDKLPK